NCSCNIAGTKRETIYHVKLPFAFGDFLQSIPFFTTSLSKHIEPDDEADVFRCKRSVCYFTLQLGIGVVQ
ncbi:MAG TPA: hypothetical protein VFA10_12580, partial [Ktedonobacteraceae bacterium]|nr:hypothetical protein [Ktedonobacteraceae bacterium]